MARDSLNAEIARQRQAELRRAAELHTAAEIPARDRIVQARTRKPVAIRVTVDDDGRELHLFVRSWRSRASLRVLVWLSRGLTPR